MKSFENDLVIAPHIPISPNKDLADSFLPPIEPSDWKRQPSEGFYRSLAWGMLQGEKIIKKPQVKSLTKGFYLHLAGILIPLGILLSIGIIYQHVGLIIGSLLLGFEGLYVLKAVAEKKRIK